MDGSDIRKADDDGWVTTEIPAESDPPPAPAQIPLGGQWNDVAVDLAQRGKMDTALACMRRALALEPKKASLLNNYGNILRRHNRHEEARAVLEQAIDLEPENPHILFNVGVMHIDYGHPGLALHYINRALEIVPGDHNFRFARACALLQNGSWSAGFDAYNCRLDGREFQIPFWDGKTLPPGKHLLVHAEQGIGDTLMFHRFVKIARRAFPPDDLFYITHAQISDICEAHRAGVEGQQEPASHCPIMSMPAAMGIDRVDGRPYLAPRHRMYLHRQPGARWKIGIVWRAKTTIKSMTVVEALHGSHKSMPLASMLELTRIEGAALYSLQHGGKPDLEAMECDHVVHDLSPYITDFSDLASFIDQMDVVVSVDTAPAHLAGALGKPVVVCLHNRSAWHWGYGERSLWYDSATIAAPRVPGVFDIDGICAKVEGILTAVDIRRAAD